MKTLYSNEVEEQLDLTFLKIALITPPCLKQKKMEPTKCTLSEQIYSEQNSEQTRESGRPRKI